MRPPSLCFCLLWLSIANAQNNQCRFYLADQYDFANNLGLSFDLEASSDPGSVCQLNTVQLALGVADGKNFRFIVSKPQWQIGHDYVAEAVITPTGSQLFLDGQLLGSLTGAFKPIQRMLYASEVLGWANGPAASTVNQSSPQISTGSSTTPILSLPTGGAVDLPLPLRLLTGGPATWQAAFNADPTQTTTLTARFRIEPAAPDPHQFDPYIDRYGQSAYGDWPSKVKSDDDLGAAIKEEQAWLSDNRPFDGLDPFGGSTVASWSGDRYTQWLQDTSAYPYCVGVSWFEYRDEPVSGRGDTAGHNAGPKLVYGEDYAFGLVDVADRPKYDLVEKVRSANLAALQSLGLQ